VATVKELNVLISLTTTKMYQNEENYLSGIFLPLILDLLPFKDSRPKPLF